MKMKTLSLLPLLLLSLISTSCWSMNSNDLVKRDGLYYKKSSDIPFTGEASGGEQDEIEWTPKIAGEWTHSYSNGEFLIKGKGKFKSGEKEGEWVFLDQDGRFSSRGEFNNGLKEGEWVENHIGYRAWSNGSYKNGKREGEWITHRESGPLAEGRAEVLAPVEKGSYKNGKKDGEWVYFWTRGMVGSIGSYKNGKEEGEWISYDNTGLLYWKGSYKNGTKEGEWNYYHDGGQFEAKGIYKNGKREGKWVEYENDGNVNELGTGIFKNGIKVSDLVSADLPNAKLIETPQYKPGMHGYD